MVGIDTHSDACRMVDVHDTFGVRSGGMHGRVKDKAGEVHSEVRCSRVHEVALRYKTTRENGEVF